jgi:REP element-mobilizing transposase RayT
MPQSLSQVLLHVVFSTKNREKTIPLHLRESLHAYIAGICRAQGLQAYRVGGTSDHVHIACSLSRTLTMAKLVEETKKSSSIWMKQQDGGEPHFSWQAGYGIFSLGQSQLPRLLQYIDDQEEHHRTISFQEELLDFLKKYEVEYDDKYLWD